MATTWHIAAHVCAKCFGRLLTRDTFGQQTNRCSNCGAESTGAIETLCACGIKLAGPKAGKDEAPRPGRNAGIRCVVNDKRSPDWPGEIVAAQVAKG